MEKDDKELMTTREIGDWLSVSRRTVYQWRQEGMPYLGSGQVLRYKKQDVEEWFNRRGGKKSHANS